MSAVTASCKIIEKTLGKSPAFRKVDDGLYVVKQGSTYVMVNVLSTGPGSKHDDRAIVRVVAQVVAGVKPEPSLFRQLLVLNGRVRFGAFAYVPEGNLILFGQSLLGGAEMQSTELSAAVHDVALIADGYDDRIVARYGGSRMQDVIEENALQHIFADPDDSLIDELE